MEQKNLTLSMIALVIIGTITGSYMYRVMSARPTFSLQTVQRGNVQETVSLTGTVVPETSVDLSFEKTGRINAINYVVGDNVSAGDVLASLDSSDEQLRLNQANAGVASAKAILEQYQENFKGAKYKLDALERDGVSKYNDKKVQEKVIDANEALVKAQEAQVLSAQNNAAYYGLQLGKNYLRAPITGIITQKNIEVGETAESAKTVFTIIKKDKYKIETYASQLDVAKLKVGDDSQISIKASGILNVLSAKIISIDPSATMQSGNSGYKVTLEFDATSSEVRAGISADALIKVGEKNDAVTISKADLIQKDNQNFVMVPDAQGKESLKKVEIGIMGSDIVEIVSGLNSGDEIFSLMTK